MASKRFVLDEGQVLRGYLIALYPTVDQAKRLDAMRRELMEAWNVLVISRETHLDHCLRWADESGVKLPPLAPRPEEEAPSEAWEVYRKSCGERRRVALQAALLEPGLGWKDWAVDYKRLRALFGGFDSAAPAQAYTALVDRFRRTKGARFKRRPMEMPLQIKSGKLWKPEPDLRSMPGVGARTNGELTFAGMKIRARWWREPEGEFLEGASIRIENFRCIASLKVKVSERHETRALKPPIGINVGLKYLCATSDGRVWENPRGHEYTVEVARRSALIDAAPDEREKRDARQWLSRYQTRYARKTRNLILTEILPALSEHEAVYYAEGTRGLKTAAQGPQARLGSAGRGGYTSAMGELHGEMELRLGEKAREVDWDKISQRCSHCGFEHEKTFQRNYLREKDGDYCRCPNPKCPEYGVLWHVDVNSARNVLWNGTKG